MISENQRRWPAPIVIGLTATGDLTFLIEDYAVAAATELDRWRAAATWGEARDLAQRAEVVGPPFAVEDLTEAEDGEEPFHVRDLGVVADGDWPPSAPTLSLALVQKHWPEGRMAGVGAVVDTVFNGPALEIAPTREQALRAALDHAGCPVRRDDDLVRRAGEL